MVEIEKKKRGRKAGATIAAKIEDPLLEPFYINVEDKCFVIFKRGESNMRGNYPNLGWALEKVVKFQLAGPKKNTTYSLKEYIDKYQQTLNKIINTIKL